MEQLSDHFLDELFKCSLYKKDVIEAICEHLKFQFIPNELRGYKLILKTLTSHYESYDTIPTIGILAQTHQLSEEVQVILERIKKIDVPDKDTILKQLEDYIKRIRFQLLYAKLAELYNNGDQNGAIDLQYKESQEISNFSIHSNVNYFHKIFEGFEERDHERRKEKDTQTSKKIPLGISAFDVLSRNGVDGSSGETLCLLARSGTGKTKFLRWCGVSAARRGRNVLHIQGEGTESDCVDGYDATWTGVLMYDLKRGNINAETYNVIEKSIQTLKVKKSDIYVKGYEEFDTATMKDVRQAVLDYYELNGFYPDELILDYLELFDPGDGKRYSMSTEGEKMRRESSARKFRNICNEFRMVGLTASQANDISPADYNNPSFVMTRHNSANAKGIVDSFSYFLTLNITSDEYKNNTARIYIDKARGIKGAHLLKLATNYDRDRFYDHQRTVELFNDDLNKTKVTEVNTNKKKKNSEDRRN